MDVVIRDRALVALDALEGWERDLVAAAVQSVESGAASPHAVLESNGVHWLLISPSLRAVLRRSEESPGRFELLDIVRPEALSNYRVDRDPLPRAAEA